MAKVKLISEGEKFGAFRKLPRNHQKRFRVTNESGEKCWEIIAEASGEKGLISGHFNVHLIENGGYSCVPYSAYFRRTHKEIVPRVTISAIREYFDRNMNPKIEEWMADVVAIIDKGGDPSREKN